MEIPDSLVERLKERQVVLVAGLGCSELAGAPGWNELTEALAGRLVFSDARQVVARLTAAGRMNDAIAFIRDLVPHQLVEEAFAHAYPEGRTVPDAMTACARFPWRAVVTTAFDDLWERALDAADGGRRPATVLTAGDDPMQAQSSGLPLLQIAGRVALPESLCLGPGDARVRLVPSAGLAWLAHMARRRSLVFVGFRPTDPDLVWLSSWLAARPSEVPHFLFLDVSSDPDADTEVAVWGLRTGFDVIPCPEGTAEGVERLGVIATSIAAQLPPLDADIDIGVWLDKWAQDPGNPQPREVLARVEAALREDERWDRLIELLLRRLDLQDEENDQLAALRDVARIFREKLATPGRALTPGIAMLRLRPTDDELWESLRADAEAAGAWEQLVDQASDIAQAAGPTPEAARIWRELARVLREHLERPDAALAAYREALVADPADRETRDAEADLLRQMERWQELAAVLHAASTEADDPARAIAHMLEEAELHEGQLADEAAAITAYESVLAIDPDAHGGVAARALERLYEKQNRWADLARLLERRALQSPPPDALALRRRRAQILADKLESLDAAAEELELLSAENPEVADRELLDLLEGVYKRADRHDDYLRTLARQADTLANPVERLAILRRLASEGEARPDTLERAAEALEQILRIEPRDAEAYAALERIYRETERPAALAAAMTRRLAVTETIEGQRELLSALAQTYERDLDEWEPALDAYSRAEVAGDTRPETYGAIDRLAERLGRWDVAAEASRKWVASAPEDAGALAAAARVRRHNGDFEGALGLFLDAAERETTGPGQAALLTEAALIVQGGVGKESPEGQNQNREEQAVELYVRALAADADHAAAAERLAEIYATRGRWSDVEELLDIVIDGLEPGETDRLIALQMKLAEACVQLGKTDKNKMDKALDALARAHEAREESLPVLHKYGDLRMQRREWKDALTLYEAILRDQRQTMSPAEQAEIAMQIGACHAELGNPERALAAYKEAKAFDGKYRPALDALAAAYAAKEDWAAWVEERRALADVAEPDERASVEEEIGDAYADKLSSPERAEACYRAALELEVGRRSTLHKLLDLYTKQGRWQPAIDLLHQLAKIEEDPAVRARTLYTAALILRDELNTPDEAASLLERCLDEAPDMAVAFEDLEALHKGKGDWKSLAHSYRRMLKRLPSDGSHALRLSLWTRLGDIAIKRLHDRKLALAAFEAAAALEPGDANRQESLAHLYELSGPDARTQAIAAHQRLLARDPHRTDSYRALAKLYGDGDEFDKQWCVASALYYLKKADPGIDAIFRRHRPQQIRLPQRPFTEEIWQRLLHPDEDRLIANLFAVAAPYLSAPIAKPPQAMGLGRRHRIDTALDRSPPVLAAIQLAEVMALPMPELFRGENENAQTVVLNLQSKGLPKPALALAPSTQRRNSFDLVFDLACQMAFLRPERVLRFAFGTPAAIELGLRAALALGAPPTGIFATNTELNQMVTYLRRSVAPPILNSIVAAGRALSEARGDTIDVTKWLAGTHLTAARTALVLTGDLGAAARVIMSEPIPLTPISVQKRLLDLVAFSVTDDY
ncbi:MAG TPA: SIR2 family protein, partial [Polyangia bacterium]|nr:SIR2 family protein [Polyangia bacterium]